MISIQVYNEIEYLSCHGNVSASGKQCTKMTVLNGYFSVCRYQNRSENGQIIYHSKAFSMYYHNLGGNVALLNFVRRVAKKIVKISVKIRLIKYSQRL